jgi:hypothetical protein
VVFLAKRQLVIGQGRKTIADIEYVVAVIELVHLTGHLPVAAGELLAQTSGVAQVVSPLVIDIERQTTPEATIKRCLQGIER